MFFTCIFFLTRSNILWLIAPRSTPYFRNDELRCRNNISVFMPPVHPVFFFFVIFSIDFYKLSRTVLLSFQQGIVRNSLHAFYHCSLAPSYRAEYYRQITLAEVILLSISAPKS